ncbi:MAG: hypothetical protein D6798_15670, partial [Deltaproteobacteria bacterium]
GAEARRGRLPRSDRRPDGRRPPTGVDGWRDLLVPVLLGGHPRPPSSGGGEDSAVDALPADTRAAWLRGLLLRGDPDRARRLLRRVPVAEHPDTGALQAWMSGDCPPRPRAGPPWQRADAWCDRAIFLRLCGQPGPAEDAIDAALACLPHHSEALALRALRRRPLPAMLRPAPALGWYSPFRIERRLHAGAWVLPTHRQRLRVQAGIRLRLASAPSCDPVEVDAMADHLRTRVLLGLPRAETAVRLWAAARRLGHPTALSAARLLVRALAPPDPVREAAAEVLARAGVPPPRSGGPTQLSLLPAMAG